MIARYGEEAVSEIHSNRDRIQLVLLDVVLPKLGGPAAYSRMCEERPDVPVVFVTGYSTDAAVLGKMQNRGLPIVQKPYSPGNLARKVRDILDQAARQ